MNDSITIRATDGHTILDALGQLIERQEDEIRHFQKVIEESGGAKDMLDMIAHHRTTNRAYADLRNRLGLALTTAAKAHEQGKVNCH